MDAAMKGRRTRTAWLCLVFALALHVVDEAMTGFLGVYNPTVHVLRERLGWFPMPIFRFEVWVIGLVTLVLVLALATPLVERGPRISRVLANGVAGLMVLNGLAHIAGSVLGRTVPEVQFERPMPGFWSSPVLITAAISFIMVGRARAAPPREPYPQT
jgi:hypothetical protein